MGQHRIAVIAGDGIGIEVVEAGVKVLEALQDREPKLKLHFETFPWGCNYYQEHGRMMAQDGLERLRTFDAIYFGAVGDPKVPNYISLWGLRLPICQGFDQYANVRPVRILPGITSPLRNCQRDHLDWVIVRENTEGEYSGFGGRGHCGMPEEVAMDTSVFTRVGVTRIMRFAFRMASKRPRRHLTLVTKSNAQRYGMVLWDEIFAEVAKDHPNVATDTELVDAVTARMILRPRTLDVVVATNLHADILSDLAAALSGSLGTAPSANLNPEGAFPSMFEPIHGSAPDIAGKGIANPIAAIWSGAMMLEHLGEAHAAAQLVAAIESITSAGAILTPDLGGNATTGQVTDAVCEALMSASA